MSMKSNPFSAGQRTKAAAYLRTSSATNAGPDKDSDRRQREAILAFANANGFEIVTERYDAAVSGADALDARSGFAALLKEIEETGVRTIIVETASRFARDLMVQEVGYAKLRERGIELIATDSQATFLDDTPTARLVRQVLGAITEFDKAITVAKLRGARDRKRATGRKVEGRKSLQERPGGLQLAAEAKRLRRRSAKSGVRRSLREIANELASQGYLSASGKPLSTSVIARLIEAKQPSGANRSPTELSLLASGRSSSIRNGFGRATPNGVL